MQLTVGNLRKIIKNLDDDVILADLGYGNEGFRPFNDIKRVLLLEGNEQWFNGKFLTINGMGSHFTGKGVQKDLKYGKCYWDENTLNLK